MVNLVHPNFVAGLSGYLVAPPRRGYGSGRQFCGVVAVSLGDATQVALFVLVAAIWVALGNGNDGNEAT